MAARAVNPSVLQELRTLRQDWDGYDARPPTGKVLASLSDRLVLVPTSAGGLQLEYSDGARLVEVEVLPTGEVGTVVVGRAS